jgi:hypothetical protein
VSTATFLCLESAALFRKPSFEFRAVHLLDRKSRLHCNMPKT